jgi:hypothetical protein
VEGPYYVNITRSHFCSTWHEKKRLERLPARLKTMQSCQQRQQIMVEECTILSFACAHFISFQADIVLPVPASQLIPPKLGACIQCKTRKEKCVFIDEAQACRKCISRSMEAECMPVQSKTRGISSVASDIQQPDQLTNVKGTQAESALDALQPRASDRLAQKVPSHAMSS